MPPSPSAKALLRYQAISAYIALDPPRGRRRAVLEQLADKAWPLPDGRAVQFAPDTLRRWITCYRRGGLAALEDRPRPRPGVQTLSPDQQAVLVQLKREVPSRSLDRILEIAESMDLLPAGLASRSTIHRVLQAHGVSGQPRPEASTADLDRFEALAPNDLWQSDLLAGPMLLDPASGKRRRAWLHAFLDDHSRVLLAGRFGFKGDLPTLELTFREALRRHGVPRRVYYDNGAIYRSHHMKKVVAGLGIHAMVFTTPYRPEGHGKIEAFNRLCRHAFLSEVPASAITTLDQLNEAFRAWAAGWYNLRVHGETGAAPLARWRAGADRVRHVGEAQIREAFLWTEDRTADRTGVLSLGGQRYQVSARLSRKRLTLRYDPEHLDEIEVWLGDQFEERARPLRVGPQRRPKDKGLVAEEPEEGTPSTADWLGHLTAQRANSLAHPDEALSAALEGRRQADVAVLRLVEEAVSIEVFHPDDVRAFLDRFGPFDAETFQAHLQLVVERGGPDQHLDTLLHDVRDALLGGA